jgi:RNA polymerase sigma-70 factor (ECF subfamily)
MSRLADQGHCLPRRPKQGPNRETMPSLTPATIRLVSSREPYDDGILPPPRQRTADLPVQNPIREQGEEVDDVVLARAVVSGQIWAQREIWYRFSPMVFGLLRRMLSRHYDHDDLAQEVFLRVFRKMATLEKPEALRSFIYSISLRVVSEEIRRFRVRVRTSNSYLEAENTVGSSPMDFEARDTLLRIQKILDQMNSKQRAVFILRHVDGLDLREIAACMDISLATVKRYLSKAVATLHKLVRRAGGLSPSPLRPHDKVFPGGGQ